MFKNSTNSGCIVFSTKNILVHKRSQFMIIQIFYVSFLCTISPHGLLSFFIDSNIGFYVFISFLLFNNKMEIGLDMKKGSIEAVLRIN